MLAEPEALINYRPSQRIVVITVDKYTANQWEKFFIHDAPSSLAPPYISLNRIDNMWQMQKRDRKASSLHELSHISILFTKLPIHRDGDLSCNHLVMDTSKLNCTQNSPEPRFKISKSASADGLWYQIRQILGYHIDNISNFGCIILLLYKISCTRYLKIQYNILIHISIGWYVEHCPKPCRTYLSKLLW